MSDDLSIILLLLEKAEQILSMVSLPDSTIKKYNELKELSCKKLDLEFIPLVKNNTQNLGNKSQQINNLSNNTYNEFSKEATIKYIILFKELISKKNILIEYFNNLIDNFIISPSANNPSVEYSTSMLIKQLENQDGHYLMKMNKSNSFSISNSINIDELEFELKLEDIKINEQVGKAETSSKRLNLISKEEQMKQGNFGMRVKVRNIFNYIKFSARNRIYYIKF